MSYESALTDFIRDEILFGRPVPLDAGRDLLSAGVLDSLGILRVIAFIEEQFGVSVPPEDVVFENFQSIQAMAQYLSRQKGAGAVVQ
jgi:acyl carrier protein